MRPISLDYSEKKGYQIVHECIKCGKLQRNKIASDTIQEDNILSLMNAFSYN